MSQRTDIATAIAFLALVALVLADPLRANHDVAMYLHSVELLSDGARPYLDFIDINPPLVVYLSALPVLIGKALSLHTILAFSLFVVALALWSLVSVRRLLARHFDAPSFALVPLALVGFSIYEWFANDFGQREHLFFLGALPYFMTRAARIIEAPAADISRRGAVLRGLIAGVFACLKPHFVVIALFPDLIHALRRRSLRPLLTPEVLAFGAAVVAYIIHFAFLPAPIFDAFFRRWVPFVWQNYSAYNAPLVEMIWGDLLFVVGVLIALMFVWPLFHERAKKLAAAALLSLAPALFFYFSQGKGWTYQQIPAVGLATLLAAMVAAAILAAPARVFATAKATARAGWRGPIAVLLIVIESVLFPEWHRTRSVDEVDFTDARNFILENSSQSDAVLIISTGTHPSYPMLLQIGRRPGSRYLWSFPLPMLYRGVKAHATGFPYRTRERAPPDEVRFLDELADDIATRRPRVILIPAMPSPYAMPKGFNIFEYLVRIDFIRTKMAEYQFRRTVQGFAAYVRKGD